MKKLALIIFGLLFCNLIWAQNNSQANQNTINNSVSQGNNSIKQEDISKPIINDLNGVWVDSNSTSFKNCYYIISQSGDQVSMTHYLEFNGTPMVERGVGTFTNGQVFFFVTVSKPIPGWATSGKHFLKLVDNGYTLRGEYQDEKGNKGPLVFKRMMFK